MVHFKFKLRTTEEGISDKIDSLMIRERTQEGLFGEMYSEGIHFTRNDSKIEGFYINVNEWETKGTPSRTRFSGTIQQQKDGEFYFKGWIYPDFISFILFSILPVIFFFRLDNGVFDKIILGIIFCLALYHSIKEEDSLYKELKRVFE